MDHEKRDDKCECANYKCQRSLFLRCYGHPVILVSEIMAMLTSDDVIVGKFGYQLFIFTFFYFFIVPIQDIKKGTYTLFNIE